MALRVKLVNDKYITINIHRFDNYSDIIDRINRKSDYEYNIYDISKEDLSKTPQSLTELVLIKENITPEVEELKKNFEWNIASFLNLRKDSPTFKIYIENIDKIWDINKICKHIGCVIYNNNIYIIEAIDDIIRNKYPDYKYYLSQFYDKVIFNCIMSKKIKELMNIMKNKWDIMDKYVLTNGVKISIAINDYDLMLFFIEKGAGMPPTNNFKMTILHKSIYNNNEKMTKYILDNYKDIQDEKNYYGRHAIHIACLINNKKILNILLDHGIDINIPDNDGNTCIMYAINNKKARLVEYLIDRKADLRITNNLCQDVLMLAISSKNVEIVKMLLRKRGYCRYYRDKDNYNYKKYCMKANVKKITNLLYDEELLY